MSVALAVYWKGKPGSGEKLREIAREMTPLTLAEPGCLFYQFHDVSDEPDTLFIYELYRDQAAVEAHRASDHFERLVNQRAQSLLEGRERQSFTTI